MTSSASNPYELGDLTTVATTVACVLFGLFVLFYLWNRFAAKSRQLFVLLCGPPGSGKTKLFTELAYQKTIPTVTSQIPNIATADLVKVFSSDEASTKPCVEAQVIDIPGSRQLLARFLPEHVTSASAVVFLVKSASPTATGFVSSTADCLMQLVEASLLGEKRKFYNVRLLFFVQTNNATDATRNSIINNMQDQLQAEIDRLTRTATGDAVPLGGPNNSPQPQASIQLSKLAKEVDWIVSRVDCDKEDSELDNAKDVAGWLLRK